MPPSGWSTDGGKTHGADDRDSAQQMVTNGLRSTLQHAGTAVLGRAPGEQRGVVYVHRHSVVGHCPRPLLDDEGFEAMGQAG